MFKYKHDFKSLIGVLILSQVALGVGPGSGNGGDLEPSTEQQIIEMVKPGSYFSFWVENVAIVGAVTQLFNPETTNDPDLKEVLEKLGGSYNLTSEKNKLRREIDKVKFVVRRECFDSSGESKDASTLPVSGAEICFSSEKLKRIPYGSLKYYMILLAYHELAHHIIGEWELGAKKFQSHIDKNGNILILKGYTLNPMNIGGIRRFKVSSKSMEIKCHSIQRAQEELNKSNLPFTVHMFPGDFLTLNLGKENGGQSTFSCMESLPVSCSVELDHYKLGNMAVRNKTSSELKKLLKEDRAANICK